MVLYIISLIILIIVLLVLFILLIKVELEVFFEDKIFDVNLKILKFIKINLKDKTKKEKKGKLDFARIKAILNGNNRDNVEYLLSKSDMEVYGLLQFGTPYPEKTAIIYGIINLFLYAIEPVVQSTFKSFKREYRVYPDLKNKRLEYKVKIKIYLKIIHFIKYKLRTMRDAKKM